ncbi:MAG: biotin transporter BioY [Candidatus Krumholzibacteriales bacterium]
MQNILTSRMTKSGLYDFSLQSALRIVLFITFTAISGQLAVYLPYTPVPVTMQTLFVVLAGIVLGPRDGFCAMAGYVALGLSGAPVFAGFAFGPAVLLGPTGGFLIAFPAGALIAGWINSQMREGILSAALSAAAGISVILAIGTASLALMAGISIKQSASLAVLPFIPGEVVKIAMAAIIIRPGSSFRRTGMWKQ